MEHPGACAWVRHSQVHPLSYQSRETGQRLAWTASIVILLETQRRTDGRSGMWARMRRAEPLSFTSLDVHVLCMWEALNKWLFSEWKPRSHVTAMGLTSTWGFPCLGFSGRLPLQEGTQELMARSVFLGSSTHYGLPCAAVCCGGGGRKAYGLEQDRWVCESWLDCLLTIWLCVRHGAGLSLSSLI